ncbi:MAG: HAMP domain-containing protein [Spirochaetaceae bacterium]|nr:MAG: HAMP domain-containing protein [Spirochaetaceae bacterium]
MIRNLKNAVILFLLFGSLIPLFSQDIFWESPEMIAKSDVGFSQTASYRNTGIAAWQEMVSKGIDEWDVYFSFTMSQGGRTFGVNSRFMGPFPYKGKPVSLFSLIYDNSGRIILAFCTDENTISFFASNDDGNTFDKISEVKSKDPIVTPRLFLTSRNEMILYCTSLLQNSLSINYSVNSSASGWSGLQALAGNFDGLGLHAVPHHAVWSGRDYVVFQSKIANSADDYQLYLKTSGDGGRSWSGARRLTDFSETFAGDGVETVPGRISNQRPFIIPFGNQLYLTWERNPSGKKPQVYMMVFNESGARIKDAQRVSPNIASCYNPQIVVYKNRLNFIWFDDSEGADRIKFAWQDGTSYKIEDLSPIAGASRFPHTFFLGNDIYLFWENTSSGTERLFVRRPDTYVQPPQIIPVNFSAEDRGKLSLLRVRWTVPADPAGIEEFEYSYSTSQSFNQNNATRVLRTTTTADFEISGEGTWYFFVRAKDLAGNYSQPSRIAYSRDSTPPGPVRFAKPDTDAEGFLKSNTFSVEWMPPSGEPVAGYSWDIKYLSDDPAFFWSDPALYPIPRPAIQIVQPGTDLNNLDNGIWAISVRAIDKAGLAGTTETLVVKLKSYIPVTIITSVNVVSSPTGELLATIVGKGFIQDGQVYEIYFDKDGLYPYDYTFKHSEGVYTIQGDSLIDHLRVPDIEEGTYRVGMIHPSRGIYFTSDDVLRVDASGTVKFGDFRKVARPSMGAFEKFLVSLSFNEILLWLLVVFLVLITVFTARKIMLLAGEAASYRMEVQTILLGGKTDMKESKSMKKLLKKGTSLRMKFTILISILVLLVVVIVALPISIYFIDTQQRNLAEKLSREVDLVMGGIVEGSKTYMLGKQTLDLVDNLQKQYSLISDVAKFAIITGPSSINPSTGSVDLSDNGQFTTDNFDHIWAYVDPNISEKIKGGTEYRTVESVIQDEISGTAKDLAEKINTRAKERITDLNRDIDRLNDEFQRQIYRTDAEGIALRERLIQEERELTKKRDQELELIAAFTGTYPEFNPSQPNLGSQVVIFYKPIVQRLRGYDNYFWGMVRMGVSMEKISQEMAASRQTLVIQVGIIALLALGLGVAGALILASITIIPIRQLRSGVAVIRDTLDKSELKDHVITVKTHDEIRELAETVNQMTQGLVKAAVASKELTVGKEVQKMFIPLETDSSGKKRTTGSAANRHVEIFGYYEGAKGVSGDYFDFKQLDETHYAIIKCDVAGKGVPAALIMVEVATIFLTYFRDWSPKKAKDTIEDLAYRINDMIEERGFKGRFAALTLCLLDSAAGSCMFCNAGDNIVQHYEAKGRKMATLKLPDAPAAGVFPSDMIRSQSGFKQVKHVLKTGDILYLFTDGMDEAKRYFRDTSFQKMTCDDPDTKEGGEHGGTHIRGSDNEEMGFTRFRDVVEALFDKKTYKLSKYHNPVPDEELVFDFTKSEGTIDEAVLAPVSMEKVFRLCPDPNAGKDDIVRVDKKIDAFLEKYFRQYAQYFKNRTENPEETDYVFFSHLKEDEQYDDLTIIAVRKK